MQESDETNDVALAMMSGLSGDEAERPLSLKLLPGACFFGCFFYMP